MTVTKKQIFHFQLIASAVNQILTTPPEIEGQEEQDEEYDLTAEQIAFAVGVGMGADFAGYQEGLGNDGPFALLTYCHNMGFRKALEACEALGVTFEEFLQDAGTIEVLDDIR